MMRAWWEELETDLPVGEARLWQLGPLTLLVARDLLEWRVGWRSTPDPLDERLILGVSIEPEALSDSDLVTEQHRFTLHGAGNLRLLPLLADRSVVVRPELPLHVPAGQQTTVYVSTPLWFRLEIGGIALTDKPTYRMSDTWFGPSTRVGEVCYASLTSARLNLDRLLQHQARAITELRLLNRGNTTLSVERIKVPVPSLSLHHTARGLWTRSLDVSWTSSGTTEISLGRIPPLALGQLAPPRRNEPLHAIARAFGAIIG